MHKQEYGWWNAVIMTENRKRVSLITVHRIVDAEVSGVNSSKRNAIEQLKGNKC